MDLLYIGEHFNFLAKALVQYLIKIRCRKYLLGRLIGFGDEFSSHFLSIYHWSGFVEGERVPVIKELTVLNGREIQVKSKNSATL